MYSVTWTAAAPAGKCWEPVWPLALLKKDPLSHFCCNTIKTNRNIYTLGYDLTYVYISQYDHDWEREKERERNLYLSRNWWESPSSLQRPEYGSRQLWRLHFIIVMRCLWFRSLHEGRKKSLWFGSSSNLTLITYSVDSYIRASHLKSL